MLNITKLMYILKRERLLIIIQFILHKLHYIVKCSIHVLSNGFYIFVEKKYLQELLTIMFLVKVEPLMVKDVEIKMSCTQIYLLQ